MAASDIMQKAQGTGGCGTSDQSFPVRLHYMLNEIEGDGLSHVISWAPHGRSFVVHKPKVFAEQVLVNWFRMSKYPSFQRQLNIYGFQRLTTGPEKGGYYHEMFLRTKPGLAYRIQRQKLKGTGVRKAAVPELEPNFYRMPALPIHSKAFTVMELPKSAPSKIGGYCTTATPAGGLNCSLRSLAPLLLGDTKPPPPRPAVTTGFSVFSSGAATSVSRPQPARVSFTSAATAADTQQHGGPFFEDAAQNQQYLFSFAMGPSLQHRPSTNTSATEAARSSGYLHGSPTLAPLASTASRPRSSSFVHPSSPTTGRSSGYVGPLVHPLLRRENPKRSTVAASSDNCRGFFTSMMSAGSAASTPSTARTTTKYEIPDFSAAWYM